jgi:6-pyruvoyltetrahydropterin/6-carboxytetrahydropterin synthase
MAETYRVRLAKECHVFSAAHFITFNGNICERLHGHNYAVRVEATGPLDENQYVIDFIALRDELRLLTDELDHHMLLPTEHPAIRLRVDEREVEATFEDRRWIFPRNDCVLLPLVQTTAALLAKYLGERLRAALLKRLGFAPQHLKIEVDENHGQWGVWEG